MTIERKVSSRSRNASPRTKAKTIGARPFIVSLKSLVPAVSPVTAYSTPPTFPIVVGIRSFRRVFSAFRATPSPPLPEIGISIRTTVPAGLTKERIGWCICPDASASFLSSASAPCTCGLFTSVPRTTSSAGV